MCTISDKIQFCSCANDTVEKLKHYWILHRYTNEKREICMGLPMIPTSMLDLNFVENQAVLLKRLNEPDVFDVPIEFKPKDQLEIVINNSINFYEAFTYSFKYYKGTWTAIESDPFDLMNRFDEEQSGKIKSPLKRNSKT